MKSERYGPFSTGFFESVAISALTFLIAAFVPFIGSVALVFIPLTILYCSCKFGRIQGLIAFSFDLLLVAIILRMLDHGTILPMILVMQGSVGIILSELFGKNHTLNKTVLASVLLIVACSTAVIAFESIQSHRTIQQMIEAYIGENLREGYQAYVQMGASSDQVAVLRENMGLIVSLLIRIYPALFFVTVTSVVWLNILAAQSIFPRKGIPFPAFGDLNMWKVPEHLVWIMIGGGGLLLIPLPWLNMVGLNLLVVCLFVYFLGGLALVSFFFRTKNASRFVRLLFYLLIFLQQYLILPVMALGLFDLWVDFRRYIKPAKLLSP